MFDEFLKSCPMTDEIKPSKERIQRNIAAVNSLIETEEGSMTTHRSKFKFKRILVTAAAAAVLMLSVFTAANAATQGSIVKFIMGGKEIEGEYYDHVDDEGYRHITFSAELPLHEENYMIIFDVDAPQGENVRVITKETDPEYMDEFFEKLRLYDEAYNKVKAAALEAAGSVEDHGQDQGSSDTVEAAEYTGDLEYPKYEDFGLAFKKSELCIYHYSYKKNGVYTFGSGTLGGEFMHTGAADGNPSGGRSGNTCDVKKGTKIYKESFYYYVGKEE